MLKKGLFTWTEWAKAAWTGVVAESREAFHRVFFVFTRPSQIECPNRNDMTNTHESLCKGKLDDTEIIIDCGSEIRRIVHCEVCGWWGCRLLGK